MLTAEDFKNEVKHFKKLKLLMILLYTITVRKLFLYSSRRHVKLCGYTVCVVTTQLCFVAGKQPLAWL